jgi:hypothetical protein
LSCRIVTSRAPRRVAVLDEPLALKAQRDGSC